MSPLPSSNVKLMIALNLLASMEMLKTVPDTAISMPYSADRQNFLRRDWFCLSQWWRHCMRGTDQSSHELLTQTVWTPEIEALFFSSQRVLSLPGLFTLKTAQ